MCSLCRAPNLRPEDFLCLDPTSQISSGESWRVSEQTASAEGEYQLPATDTVPASTATPVSIGGNSSVRGFVNSAGDQDWYAIQLTAGQSYTFALNGIGQGALADPFLRLLDASGGLVGSDDDSGPLTASRLTRTVNATGTYYLSAEGFGGSTGQYQLTAALGNSPYFPTISFDTIADYLTNTYWEISGVSPRHWGGTALTFNVQGLSPQRANLARAAFQEWSEVANLTFQETSGSANITVDDNDANGGAYANATTSGGLIQSASINVPPSWFGGSSAIDSYTFQTFIHEIGHTLGLGHSGPYNGSATYGIDNSYANDSWQASIMSYMDQSDAGTGSERFVMTPMMADIIAAQRLYGAATARPTDTIYGFGSTAGQIYDFSFYTQAPALTIYDSGGIDTLNASGYSQGQFISLIPGTFSNIGGLTGNIAIFRSSTIENARGGSGIDTIYGNDAANQLWGNAGADVLRGGLAVDTLVGGAQADTFVFDAVAFTDAQASVFDVLSDYDQGNGGAYNFTEGDELDLSVLLTAAHASGQATSSLARVLSDAATGVSNLQIDIDGLLNGVAWTTIARLDGIQTGHHVTVTFDSLDFELIVSSRVHIISDFNGDTRDDILWRRTDGSLMIFNMNGPQIISSALPGQIGTEWSVQGTADFNGDFYNDMLWRRTDGTVMLFEVVNNAVQKLTVVGQVGNEWQIAGPGDFNGDGFSDILWRRNDGTLLIFDMQGPQITSVAMPGNVGVEWQVVGTGDYNGDATSDLLWRRTDGAIMLFEMANNQAQKQTILGQVGNEWRVAGSGDFNGDGNDDIMWQRTDGALMIFDMGQSGIRSVVMAGQMGTDWHLEATGDYNGDQTGDLLWRHDQGSLQLFEMAQNQVQNSTIFGQVGLEWQIV